MFVLVPPGIPGLITADMVKEGAAVIDIGRQNLVLLLLLYFNDYILGSSYSYRTDLQLHLVIVLKAVYSFPLSFSSSVNSIVESGRLLSVETLSS